MEIIFSRDGKARCIYDDVLVDILRELGPVRTARASHVEPDENGEWWADLRPCAGPRLGPFHYRGDALTAEKVWLTDHDVPLPEALR